MSVKEKSCPLADIFDILPDPAFLFRQQPDKKIVLVKINRIGQKIFREQYQADRQPTIVSSVKHVIETGEPIRDEIEFEIVTDEEKLRSKERIPSKKTIYLADYVKLSDEDVLVLTKDITELKKSQKEMRDSQEFNFGLLAEYSPLGIMYLSSEGNIKYTNPTVTRSMEISDNKFRNIVGKSIFSLPEIQKNHEIKKGVQKLLNGEPIVSIEIQNPNGDLLSVFGTPRFAPNGSVTGAVFMYLESVQHEETQAALREREEYDFGLMTEYSPLGIINLNTNGIITFANPTSTKMFGWQDGQVSLVEGKNFLQLPYISEKPIISEGIDQLLEGEPLVGLEFTIDYMGTERVLRTYGSPHYDQNGDLDGAILMYADITDLKETQKELQKQREELSEFAHQMTHDLLTSIVSISGFAELLSERYDQSFIDRIVKNAERMKKLLKTSLKLADAGKIIDKKHAINLGEIVDEVAELAIPNDITLQREPLPIVACDREKTS
ncbi:PAS domain S-box protein, partial [Candidatus Pacearchaeota archaeon]|nr:PAS domain S-box protein [Candidatus Pacearchaeota archaeon]